MSFDFVFLPSSSVPENPADGIKALLVSDQPGTPQQMAQMLRLIDEVRAADPSVEYRESDKGIAYGGWLGCGSGALPDIDIYPSHLFLSMHLAGAPLDDTLDVSFREKVITFFEHRGYVGYDPQKSRLVTSSDFSFSDDLTYSRRPVSKNEIRRPWWQFW